jgi:2-oxoglutarate dehydrogenase E2 component (dihydrolipoamide succinyltransferase)
MPVDIVIPSVGESITSGVIAVWRKKTGEFVERDEVVLDLETDKITMEVRAPAAGVLQSAAKEGETVNVGAVVGRIDESAPPPGKPAATATSHADSARPGQPASEAAAAEGPGVRATPLARKVATELGVDLSKIQGTGAGSRVREQDVVSFAQAGPGGGALAPTGPSHAARAAESNIAAVTGAAQAIGAGADRAISRERLTPIRLRIAQRLVEAQHTAAMLTTFNECDMSAVMALRGKYKEDFEKRHGVGLGFMSFFVNACVQALQAFPLVNASLVADESGQLCVEKHDYCDIAIAVASPKGLVVPVIRNCEGLSFAQIESRIKELGLKAKDGKLTLAEMQGGTFTITNGGIFGSLMSTPILNPPQAAILGMHAIKPRAVEHPAGSGQVAVRPMMYLALSYDHRLIDGAEAVRFLVTIKNAIEDPQRLLLDL